MTLISDAGTPTISDPGFRLINQAILEGLTVQTLPGNILFFKIRSKRC